MFVFGLLVGLMLLVAACAAPATQPAASQSQASAAEQPAEQASTSDTGFDGVIKIGAAVSETGRYGTGPGEDTRNGYDLWLDWVNNEYGGVKVGDRRYKVEIIYYDDESDPDTAASLVEKLITEDEVQFILGPYSSGLTMSTSAITERYGKIMVEGNGSSETLFERGFQNLFAVLTPAGNYSESALKALADRGAKTVFVANADDAFSVSVADGAMRWAEEYGLEVVARESYPEDITDVTGIMTKARELNPDVFLGATHLQDAMLLVRSAQEVGFNPKAMILTAGPGFPEFIEEFGKTAEYILSPTQWAETMGWKDEYLGTAADYAARFEKMFGDIATYQAAESTATALALHIAIEQAGSLDTAAVRDALRNMDIVTFYGPIRFDETGKNVGKPMASFQIQNGENVVVAPAEAAIADFVYPMPAWQDK
jgi:branched-chain amino acid transport system substrate-binding protein